MNHAATALSIKRTVASEAAAKLLFLEAGP